MKRFDCNCFAGNWPFYKVRYNTVEKIRDLHERIGITGGFISACESIFYQDPYEAEADLAEKLKGTPYHQAMILNPTLPGWKADLKRGVEELNIKAVRLMPTYHKYALTDPVLKELADAVKAYDLPLLLTFRLRDERCMWMFQADFIDIGQVRTFLETYTDIPTLLTDASAYEMQQLADVFKKRTDLFADCSGLKDGLFAADRAYEVIGDRLVYGSAAPLLEMQASFYNVTMSLIPEDAKPKILSGENFLALCKL